MGHTGSDYRPALTTRTGSLRRCFLVGAAGSRGALARLMRSVAKTAICALMAAAFGFPRGSGMLSTLGRRHSTGYGDPDLPVSVGDIRSVSSIVRWIATRMVRRRAGFRGLERLAVLGRRTAGRAARRFRWREPTPTSFLRATAATRVRGPVRRRLLTPAQA